MNQHIQAEGPQCRQCEQRQQAAIEFFHAVKETILAIPSPVNPIRYRLQAAADLFALGHIPKRPLPDLLQREADVVGAGLDSEALEQVSLS